MTTALAATRFDSRLSRRVFRLVSHVACLPDVKAAVEANHDENRWWPTRVTDPRMRMLVAGWSTRVSYRMVDVYARVVAEADALGMERLIALSDEHVVHLVAPIGLPGARTRYLRSLVAFLDHMDAEGVDPVSADIDELIGRFAAAVDQASFKVAQCALLYARGYHCGVIPVDSGMVTKLAPVLGISLPAGPVAHELMRMLLQDCVSDRAAEYRRLADEQRYNVHLPVGSPPMWWTHLVLIYFKRLYLNHPEPRLCPARPVCDAVLDCRHSGQPDRAAPTRSPPHSGPLRAIGLSLPTRFRRRRVRSRGTAWCRRDDRRLRCQGTTGVRSPARPVLDLRARPGTQLAEPDDPVLHRCQHHRRRGTDILDRQMTSDPLLAEYRIVAVEGCDGTGKTTLARTLAANGDRTVVHSPYTRDDVDLLGRYRHILATPGRLVLDRCFVSELVYGPLYRQRSRLSWPDAVDLARELAVRNGVFVHLTGQAVAVQARLLSRNGAAPNLAEIDRLMDAYQRVFASLAVYVPVVQRDLGDGSAASADRSVP